MHESMHESISSRDKMTPNKYNMSKDRTCAFFALGTLVITFTAIMIDEYASAALQAGSINLSLSNPPECMYGGCSDTRYTFYVVLSLYMTFATSILILTSLNMKTYGTTFLKNSVKYIHTICIIMWGIFSIIACIILIKIIDIYGIKYNAVQHTFNGPNTSIGTSSSMMFAAFTSSIITSAIRLARKP